MYFPRWQKKKHSIDNTHVFFMLTTIIRADRFQKIYIKRRVSFLQIVRCTPIVFNTSFASGPVVRANVFCSLIKVQKRASERARERGLRRLTE